MPFESPITSPEHLRELYRPPSRIVASKAVDHLDGGAAELIARSPFFVFATAGGAGADASPRGGPPGFVTVLDSHRLAFGDLSGNNRLDSFANLVAQLGLDPKAIEDDLEAGYAATMWVAGGIDQGAR